MFLARRRACPRWSWSPLRHEKRVTRATVHAGMAAHGLKRLLTLGDGVRAALHQGLERAQDVGGGLV